MSIDESEGDINASPYRADWQERHLNEDSKRLLKDDAKYFFHQALSTPCLNVLSACEGSTVTDFEGRHYLDFHGNAAHQIGFRNPAVMDAIKHQLDTLPFTPRRYTNEPAIALAKALTDAAPMNEARLLFAPGGAEVNSMALQYARQATGRFKTISFWGAFHGGTLDMISLGGEAMFRANSGPLLPGCIHVPPPGVQGASWEDSVAHLDYVMSHEGDIAAIFAEPIRCTNMTPPPAEYWQAVRGLCDQHGALLIFDEIPIGLGRSGHLFCCEYTGIIPDIVCLGKGLGGGVIPLAAMIARADLNIAQDRAIGHFTHEKNPVACAAGLAAFTFIQENNLVEKARTSGAAMLEQLHAIQERHDCIVEARGMGLLLALDLASTQADVSTSALTDKVLYGSLERGLNFKTSSGSVIVLTPPLTVTDAEIEEAVAILDDAIRDATGSTS
jgi:(R)-1-hydroxy-2-aminoethylphosphonate ammonia-lyase